MSDVSSVVPPHVERMLAEHKELVTRMTNLEKFIKSNPHFLTLEPAERADMADQCYYMKQYENILYRRVERATKAVV